MRSGRSAGALLAGTHGTGGGAPRTNAPHLHAMRTPCRRSWQRSVALPPASGSSLALQGGVCVRKIPCVGVFLEGIFLQRLLLALLEKINFSKPRLMLPPSS